MILRNKITPAIFLAILLPVNFSDSNYPADYSDSIYTGGLRRTFLFHLPKSFDRTISSPLLLALHGGGGTGRNMVKLTLGEFNNLSDERGFIVVYPDGVRKHWNDGRSDEETGYRAHKDDIDDVGFISALIDHFIKEMNADPERVYVTGMSNGAIMAYKLGCQLSGKITAIAPVAGNMAQNLTPECTPSGSVSVLAINNVNDPLVPYTGGNITGPFGRRILGKVLSARESIKFWVNQNKCATTPVISCEPDRDPGDGTRVRKEEYINGKNNSEVVLYSIEGGGHTWPGGYQYLNERIIGKSSMDLDACSVIWDFFERHSSEH